jgi:hypothetical protein
MVNGSDKTPQDASQYEDPEDVGQYEDPEVPERIDEALHDDMAQLAEEVRQAEAAPTEESGMVGAGAPSSIPPVKVVDLTARTSPNVYNNRPNGVASIKGILLHHTGSSNEDGDIAWLSQPHANPVSTHKVFKRNGTIFKLVPDDRRAWHAGPSTWHGQPDCNDSMLGYEICNNGVGEAFTDAQYESVAQSIAYDCALYHIRDANVTTHKAVRDAWLSTHPGQAQRKNDPKGLNIDRIWARVEQVRADWPFGPEVALWFDSTPWS